MLWCYSTLIVEIVIQASGLCSYNLLLVPADLYFRFNGIEENTDSWYEAGVGSNVDKTIAQHPAVISPLFIATPQVLSEYTPSLELRNAVFEELAGATQPPVPVRPSSAVLKSVPLSWKREIFIPFNGGITIGDPSVARITSLAANAILDSHCMRQISKIRTDRQVNLWNNQINHTHLKNIRRICGVSFIVRAPNTRPACLWVVEKKK